MLHATALSRILCVPRDDICHSWQISRALHSMAAWSRASSTFRGCGLPSNVTKGRRRCAYHDTEGVLTTGIGHNLEVDLLRKTWTDNEIDRLFADDIAVSCAGAKALVSREAWALMGAERREVLVEMVFQLGCAGVGNFRRFREALEACDYEWAAGEMLWRKWRRGLPSVRRSLWRIQTPARCERLAEIMRTGHISQGGNT